MLNNIIKSIVFIIMLTSSILSAQASSLKNSLPAQNEFPHTRAEQIDWIITHYPILDEGFRAIQNNSMNGWPNDFYVFLNKNYPQDVSDTNDSFQEQFAETLLHAHDKINNKINDSLLPELQVKNPNYIHKFNTHALNAAMQDNKKGIIAVRNRLAPMNALHNLENSENPITKYALKYKDSATNIAVKYALRRWIMNTPDKNNNDQTVLHTSIERKNNKLAQLLIELGANTYAQDKKNGWTPFHYTIKEKNLDLVQVLLDISESSLNIKDINGWTPLHQIIMNKNLHTYWTQQNRTDLLKDTERWTSFNNTTSYKDLDVVQLLLKHGANPNNCDNDHWTPLHLAVNYNDLEATQLLLEHGADPNSLNQRCQTPLHLAAENNNLPIAELLLIYKADKTIASSQHTQHGIFAIPLDYATTPEMRALLT